MALKFLRKKTTKLKSFLREYSISLYLSPCPFIINMYGIAFETDDYYVFAQEFAPAGELFDIIPPQVRPEVNAGSPTCRPTCRPTRSQIERVVVFTTTFTNLLFNSVGSGDTIVTLL